MSQAPAKAQAGLRASWLRGFTLLELLVVVAIMAIATAGVSLALRDSSQTQLEREAQRLVALLESARMQSRAHGVVVRWQASAQGFGFEGLSSTELPRDWLSTDTAVRSGDSLVLGPEPIIEPQAVVIYSVSQPQRSLRIATDGLRPFAVLAEEAGAAP
jgi:general secretion pathway protein H